MGVMHYERNRQRQQNIEVKALIALMRYGRTHARKAHAEKKLCEIAFPEDHIKQAEQETLVLSGNMLRIELDDDETMESFVEDQLERL